MMNCIFCQIIEGKIPAFKVLEDEHTLAFMDINPVSEGHCLVIPKAHTPNLLEAPPQALANTLASAQKVAKAMYQSLGIDSLNLVQNNGPWALQTVGHLHFHLIPRREKDGIRLDWDLNAGDMPAIGALGERIKEAL